MFGVSTFCLNDQPLSSTLERIIALTNYIEVMDEGLHYLENAEGLESYDAHFTIHSPCRGTNIASLLEPIRRASVEVIGQCFSIASLVNAGVVVHPGYFAWAMERQKAEQQCRKSIIELMKLSIEYGIPCYIENMGNWEYFLIKSPDELSLIGNAAFALDVGHANQNRCLDEFLKYPIQHFHLHDNNGKEDSHIAIGEGTIDFTPVMNAVRKNGVIPIIEVASFDGVMKSIERLKVH
ncbi:MAG: sugar phosphate isomerase/epimerase [Methanoregulaceae archaeon]|jgi:sugar phosphate isomerase/epimerase